MSSVSNRHYQTDNKRKQGLFLRLVFAKTMISAEQCKSAKLAPREETQCAEGSDCFAIFELAKCSIQIKTYEKKLYFRKVFLNLLSC